MKIKLILAFLFCALLSKAQSADTLYFNSFDEGMEHIYGLLDTNNYPSGILINKSVGETNAIYHNGLYSDSTINYYDWLLMQNKISQALANHKPLNFPHFLTIDSISKNVFANENTILIGILHYNYHQLSDSAVVKNQISSTTDKRLLDNLNRNESPYTAKKVFLAMPLINSLTTNNSVKFEIANELFFTNDTNQIQSIEIDFDDEAGFREISTNQKLLVNYLTSGTKIIKCKFNYADTVFYSKVVFNVLIKAAERRNEPVVDKDEYHTVSYSNNLAHQNLGGATTVTARYGVWYACGRNDIRKPYIISGGFNPLNGKDINPLGEITPEFTYFNNNGNMVGMPINFRLSMAFRGTFYEMMNGQYRQAIRPEIGIGSIPSGKSDGDDNDAQFLNKLRAEGFDIVIVMYDNGVDYVENNAHAFIEVLKQINTRLANNGSKHEVVISGYSAGAFTTRYALALMEKEYNIFKNTSQAALYPPHRCRSWVSVEQESQGANTPLGMQYFLNYNLHALPYKAPDILGSLLANTALEIINSDAAKQLSKYHYQAGNTYNNNGTMNFANQHQLRTDMLQRFNNLNTLPGGIIKGYPLLPRKIGISMGSGIGQTTKNADGYVLQPGTSMYDLLIDPVSITGITLETYKIAQSYWLQHGPSMVFYGKDGLHNHNLFLADTYVFFRVPYVPFPSGIVSASNAKGWDTAPGSYINTTNTTHATTSYRYYLNLLGSNSHRRYKYNNTPANPLTKPFSYQTTLHSFSPTVSGLDIHDHRFGYVQADLFTTPDELELLYKNNNNISGTKSLYREYGFPHIKHPADHYKITPYDAIWNVGDRNVQLQTGLPPNHFHDEDPQPEMTNFILREVAPHTLLLQNRTIQGETNRIYAAAFEARDAVIIGKSVFQATDDWREPIADYIIDAATDVDVQAGHNITLKPGTTIKTGSRCRLHIQNDFMCTQAVFRPVAASEEIPDIAPYDEQYIKTFLPQKSESINQIESVEEVINVFPNPSNTGLFNCQITTANLTEKTAITVTDMLGKMVEQVTISDKLYNIDLSNYTKGVYIVQCVTNTKVFTKKIIYE